LARDYAELGQFDDAWRSIDEAMTAVETTKERWCETEVLRTAAEIALKTAEPDAVKAEAYFTRALTIARAQQAKSWELRAAMSMARLWRAQGKRNEARDLLDSVYGWFTEGFDTLDRRPGLCSTRWRNEDARVHGEAGIEAQLAGTWLLLFATGGVRQPSEVQHGWTDSSFFRELSGV
jgi:predicted ATPase